MPATIESPSTNIAELKRLTRMHLQADRHDEARSLCRSILDLRPDDAEAIQLLSQCRFDLEEFTAELPELPCISPASWGLGNELTAEDPSAPLELRPSGVAGLLGDYATRSQTWASLGPEHLMQQLICGAGHEPIRFKSSPTTEQCDADGYPLPPVELTMSYGAGDLDRYRECGRRSHAVLTSILAEQNICLTQGNAILDWGCAAGRVVRTFTTEAEQGCDVWGCDVDAPAIEWAQDHLSPPFRFFNCTAFPRLPFPDDTFNFIYGLSVFTHLVVFRDMWLLELARILKPGGCAVMTVHDEHCWRHFQSHGMPDWVPPALRHHSELPAECVEIRGSRWDQCYTFFHSDYIHRVWGRFLDIVDIKPMADSYQAAVIMRKPWSSAHTNP